SAASSSAACPGTSCCAHRWAGGTTRATSRASSRRWPRSTADVSPTGVGSGAPAARASPPPLTVTGRLPSWRALGVPLALGGFADAHERVRLLANGRRVASTLSGRFGRYRLTFPAERAGRFRLTVTDGTRSRRVGTLTVRPVVLD